MKIRRIALLMLLPGALLFSGCVEMAALVREAEAQEREAERQAQEEEEEDVPMPKNVILIVTFIGFVRRKVCR